MNANYSKAREKAEDLLSKYDISTPPIRIEDVIKGEGLQVYEADFNSPYNDVSGFIDPEEKTIYVNKSDNDNRQAFTLAHELGHWVLHKSELNNNADLAILYRKSGMSRNDDIKEKEANCFAANILVPKEMLDAYINDFSVPKLAQIFGVSKQVIAFRLQFEYGQ